jgi:hypothetical protein
MKDVIVKLTIDDTGAIKSVENMQSAIKDIGDEAEKTGDKVEGVGKSASKSRKGFAAMGKGIKAVGTALKAAGIGLVIALVAGLTEAFSRNKRIMDGVSVVLGTIQEVFTQVADALIATYDAVAQSSDNFDALGKVMGGILTLILTPFKLTFFGIQLALQKAQLAWEDSFFGGGDEEKMAQLRLDIEDTKTSISEVADEASEAGSTIVDNFAEAVTEVGNITEIASENLSKVSIKAANETSKAYKAAKDAAILAQAESAALRAGYELEAAELKKIRDNVNLSLEERIKANDDLAVTSAKAEEQMKRQAQLAINLAELELKKNNSIENQAALIQANADLKAVEAEIAGKTEEVETNRVGLLNEQNALILTGIESERERNKLQREFDAEQEVNPLVKLEKQKTALELENEAILKDLEAKRLLYAEGTQQRVDAEQDYLNKKQGIDNQLVANTKATNEQIKANDQATAEAKRSIQEASLDAVAKGFNILAGLAEENKQLQAASIIAENATGIAKQIINTQAANAVAAPLLSNPATAAAGAAAITRNKISLGIGIASSIAAAAKGLAALNEGGDTSGGAEAGGAGGAEAPAFNLVEGTESNAIQDSITNQESAVKAFVVSGEVTTAQSADRNIVEGSGF